jgi:hypothetical protein
MAGFGMEYGNVGLWSMAEKLSDTKQGINLSLMG